MTVLSLPSGAIPASATWSLEQNVGGSQNPLGNTIQRIQRDGGRWRADLTFPTMAQDQGALFAAYLDKASRGDMWTYITPPHNDARGNWGPDELVVNGGHSSLASWAAGTGAAINVNARRLRVKVGGSPGVVATALQSGLATEVDQPHVFMADLTKGSTANWRIKLYPTGSPSQDEHVSYYEDEGRVVFVHIPETSSTTIELACNSTTEQDYCYFSNVTASRCLLVNDALAVGNECDVRGGPTSVDGAIKAGEFVTIQLWNGWQMVRLTEDLDTDSSGNGTLRFEPSLRDGVGQAVIVHKPFCRMFIPAHASPHAIDMPRLHGFSVSYLEDVTEIGIEENPQDTDLIWYWDAHSYSLAPSIGTGTPTITNGSKAYTDANGLAKFTALDTDATASPTPYEPAFDHDIYGALKGVLIEEARTNEALWARDLTRSSWTKTNTTAALDETGEDGVEDSCSSILATAANGTVTQAITSASNTTRAFAVSIKRLIGSGTIEITLDNANWKGVGGSVTASEFTRVAHTATLANPTVGIRLGTSGDKVAVDFCQEEAGVFATSRILTTSATVARTIDSETLASNVVTNFPSGGLTLTGKHLLDFTGSSSADRVVVCLDDGTGNNQIAALVNSTETDTDALVRAGAATQASLDGGANAAGQALAWALGASANDFAHATGGSAAAVDVAGSIPTVTTIRPGNFSSGAAALNGHLLRLGIYKAKKPNRQIRSLSA